jgi:hypothetical protein
MKEAEIKEIKALHKKYINAKRKYQSNLGILIEKLAEVTGKEINYNEFESDGLGICAGGGDTYMSMHDAIALIKEKGTINEDDFTYL